MFTNVNNRTIHYEIINQQYGGLQKPLIVFLHEGLGSIRQWKNFPQKLCNQLKFQGLIYDRYGYGLSEQLKEERKITFLHDEGLIYLPGLLENLKIKNKLILIGHSDGGSIALIYASVFSENLLCIISEAAHVMLEDISLQGIRSIKNEYEQNESFRKMFSKYHPGKAENMFYNWVNTWLSPDFKNWNIENLLEKITAPVLAIQGDKDEYGTYKQLESIRNHSASEVEIFYIPQCGHTPHLQAEEMVFQKMSSYVMKFSK